MKDRNFRPHNQHYFILCQLVFSYPSSQRWSEANLRHCGIIQKSIWSKRTTKAVINRSQRRKRQKARTKITRKKISVIKDETKTVVFLLLLLNFIWINHLIYFHRIQKTFFGYLFLFVNFILPTFKMMKPHDSIHA